MKALSNIHFHLRGKVGEGEWWCGTKSRGDASEVFPISCPIPKQRVTGCFMKVSLGAGKVERAGQNEEECNILAAASFLTL